MRPTVDLLEDWGILVGIACSALGFGVSHYLIDTQTHASREKKCIGFSFSYVFLPHGGWAWHMQTATAGRDPGAWWQGGCRAWRQQQRGSSGGARLWCQARPAVGHGSSGARGAALVGAWAGAPVGAWLRWCWARAVDTQRRKETEQNEALFV